MTRKEQIKEYLLTIGNGEMNIPFDAGFECGVEWADRTMIEKACEWLENNLDGYLVIEEDGNDCYIHSNIYRDFMGAMKGGEQ